MNTGRPDTTMTASELFRRAEDLGYDARRAFLAEGEAALVADPVESPEWYVDYPESIAEAASSDLVRLRELAADVISWSDGVFDDAPTELSLGESGRAARLRGD